MGNIITYRRKVAPGPITFDKRIPRKLKKVYKKLEFILVKCYDGSWIITDARYNLIKTDYKNG